MTTQPRPSLADTIARIDAVLAEPPILPLVGMYLRGLNLDLRAAPGPVGEPSIAGRVLAEQQTDLPFGYVTLAERDLVARYTGLDTGFMTRTPSAAPVDSEIFRALAEDARFERTYMRATAPRDTAPPDDKPGWLDRLLRKLFG